MNDDRELIIKEIKELIVISKDDVVEINPAMLDYFNDEDLIAMRNDLFNKKKNIREENASWLNEIYEKTKKD